MQSIEDIRRSRQMVVRRMVEKFPSRYYPLIPHLTMADISAYNTLDVLQIARVNAPLTDKVAIACAGDHDHNLEQIYSLTTMTLNEALTWDVKDVRFRAGLAKNMMIAPDICTTLRERDPTLVFHEAIHVAWDVDICALPLASHALYSTADSHLLERRLLARGMSQDEFRTLHLRNHHATELWRSDQGFDQSMVRSTLANGEQIVFHYPDGDRYRVPRMTKNWWMRVYEGPYMGPAARMKIRRIIPDNPFDVVSDTLYEIGLKYQTLFDEYDRYYDILMRPIKAGARWRVRRFADRLGYAMSDPGGYDYHRAVADCFGD